MSTLVYNALQTPDGTILESRHRHDYVTYVDANGKEYMIDGGLDYIRCSAHGDEKMLSLTTGDPLEVLRSTLRWGTRGKSGVDELKYVKIMDLETGHIEAVLSTQKHLHKGYKNVLELELQYRETVEKTKLTGVNKENE